MGNPKFLLRTTVVSNSQWLKYDRKKDVSLLQIIVLENEPKHKKTRSRVGRW